MFYKFLAHGRQVAVDFSAATKKNLLIPLCYRRKNFSKNTLLLTKNFLMNKSVSAGFDEKNFFLFFVTDPPRTVTKRSGYSWPSGVLNFRTHDTARRMYGIERATYGSARS